MVYSVGYEVAEVKWPSLASVPFFLQRRRWTRLPGCSFPNSANFDSDVNNSLKQNEKRQKEKRKQAQRELIKTIKRQNMNKRRITRVS